MSDEPEREPSFEQALEQLERIVASLERGEPELTTALASYEKGVRLLALCQRHIDQAEQSVALLTGVDDSGNPLTAPFDAAPPIARDSAASGPRAADPAPAERESKSPQRSKARASRPIPPGDPQGTSDLPF